MSERQVIVPALAERLRIIKAHLVGARRRRAWRPGDAPQAPESEPVRKFFETKSADEGFGNVTDAGREWYLACLAGSPPVAARLGDPVPLRVLDVGCSRASVLRWLREERRGVALDYVGTDLDEVAVERCREAYGNAETSFVAEDLTRPSLDAEPGFDLVFCINVLPYIGAIDAAAATLAARCRAGGLLVVMEPVPSSYWSASFGGFRIHLREPGEWRGAVDRTGLEPEDDATLSTMLLLGRPRLPLAAMTVWRKPA